MGAGTRPRSRDAKLEADAHLTVKRAGWRPVPGRGGWSCRLLLESSAPLRQTRGVLKRRSYPAVVLSGCAGMAAVALAVFLGGCTNPYAPGAGMPAGPAHTLGGKKTVTIDSSPSSALISVNGAVKGGAPVDIEVDVDELGDVAMSVSLTANFADSFTGAANNGGISASVSYEISRGEAPPSVVRFDPTGASAH